MRTALFIFVLALPALAPARTFMTQEQALAAAFPPGTKAVRQTFFLSPQQLDSAKKASGVEVDTKLVIRYAGMRGNQVVGWAYFDSHRVRTLPETVMVVVAPDGTIGRIDILSFSEPEDYFPRPRWIDQLRGRKLDPQLQINRAVRPITGASLTGRAIVNASRRVLALHGVIGEPAK